MKVNSYVFSVKQVLATMNVVNGDCHLLYTCPWLTVLVDRSACSGRWCCCCPALCGWMVAAEAVCDWWYWFSMQQETVPATDFCLLWMRQCWLYIGASQWPVCWATHCGLCHRQQMALSSLIQECICGVSNIKETWQSLSQFILCLICF